MHNRGLSICQLGLSWMKKPPCSWQVFIVTQANKLKEVTRPGKANLDPAQLDSSMTCSVWALQRQGSCYHQRHPFLLCREITLIKPCKNIHFSNLWLLFTVCSSFQKCAWCKGWLELSSDWWVFRFNLIVSAFLILNRLQCKWPQALCIKSLWLLLGFIVISCGFFSVK